MKNLPAKITLNKCFPKEGSNLPTIQFYMANFQHLGLKTVYEEENSYLFEI